MKKALIILSVVFLALTGCGKKSGTIKCTMDKDLTYYKIESTYKINYTGKTVDSVETVERAITDNSTVLDTLEKTLKETYENANKTYGGYTIDIKKSDKDVVSTVTIDYNKMNISQFVKDQPSLKSYVDGDKLTVDGIKSIYVAMGATCE